MVGIDLYTDLFLFAKNLFEITKRETFFFKGQVKTVLNKLSKVKYFGSCIVRIELQSI